MKIRIGPALLIKTACAYLLLCATALAQTHEFMLDNGLKLLVKEDHRAPVVVSQVWYKVGASYEVAGQTGISHALEHMMFKGTEKHGPGEFSRIISANGGNENAFTGSDFTAYFQTLEKTRLPISFEMESDRMRNLSLPAEEFAKEIEVVMEERRLRTEDNPQSFVYESMMATAFQTSPYRQPIIGWMEDLEQMSADQLAKWYERYYAPNNAVVVVVGDVDAKEVYKLAKKHFGPLTGDEIEPDTTLSEVAQNGKKRIVVKRPAELPYLLMAYKTPSLKSAIDNPDIPDWEPYALEVLAGIMDGGMSARLETELVRGSELASGISLNYRFTSRLDTVLTIGSVPANDVTVEQLEQAIREQVQKIKTETVSQAELDRVKAQVIADDVYQRDSIFYQGMVIGMFESIGLSWKQVEDYVPAIKQITAEQVMTVANKYLVDDGLTVAVLDPQPIDPSAAGSRTPGGPVHDIH
jgi:zinc protease